MYEANICSQKKYNVHVHAYVHEHEKCDLQILNTKSICM